MKLTSFGGLTAKPLGAEAPAWENTVSVINGLYLPTGMSRSYGDVAIVDGASTISSLGMNRFLNFNTDTGVLVCEPGVLLKDIQEVFVKQGWMLHVTPGTALVTVGGAIANDIHGKDHHLAGTFGDHVLGFTLLRSDGSSRHCSATENSDFFRATIGGLGLTGFITNVSLQLKRVAGPYFETEVIPYYSLSEFFELSRQTEDEGWQASVSWFDCSTSKAGRGSFTRGNVSDRKFDAAADKKGVGLSVPFTPPISLINKFTLDVFNTGYFQLQKAGAGKRVVHFKEFYYPLDGVANWNRIYGPKGFFQYQSVIPMEHAEAATDEMLRVIKASGQGSFLAVLKTFADRKPAGMLSFARHGVTLALDFPNRGTKTEALMQSLDRIVSEAGGALNPSKDARMSRELFVAGFPGLEEFKRYRDPKAVSNFSRRVID